MDYDNQQLLGVLQGLENRIAQLEGEKRATAGALAHWRREADRDSGEICRLRQEVESRRAQAQDPSEIAELLAAARGASDYLPFFDSIGQRLDKALKPFEEPNA